MTRFEKDYHEMLKGAGLYILQGRRAEIQKLKKEQRACKNRFRFSNAYDRNSAGWNGNTKPLKNCTEPLGKEAGRSLFS